MYFKTFVMIAATIGAGSLVWDSAAGVRTENFDHPPLSWEGINNHNTNFPPRKVSQDFGYSADSLRLGNGLGEVGGRINPAGEAAYYACRLPKALTLDDSLSASGDLLVMPGPGHFLLGFFNA